jgi:hypothetical protein
MPTYKISPFVTGLQNYLFTGADIDHGGKINISGAPGSIYAAKLDNENSGGATNYFLIWDGTEATASAADIVIPIKHTELITMWVDKGITCSTAITVSASSAATGTGATSGTANVVYHIS